MTNVDISLAQGETLILEREELIFRQIADWMVKAGSILTHVFGPSTSDAGMPSYSRSSVVAAQDARDGHNRNVQSRSLGVRALSVDEVFEVGRYVVDDAAAENGDELRAPGHCFVDFRGLSKPQIKSIRYLLYTKAIDRGEIPTHETKEEGQLF